MDNDTGKCLVSLVSKKSEQEIYICKNQWLYIGELSLHSGRAVQHHSTFLKMPLKYDKYALMYTGVKGKF